MTDRANRFSRERRQVIAASLAAIIGSPALAGSQPLSVFRPEDFGAIGDGRADDTAAFGQMSRAVSQAGGGTIVLSKRTYMVGKQRRAQPPLYGFEPQPIIDLEGLRLGVTIEGGGAVLKANPGGLYGSFDVSGTPLRRAMPFFDAGALASPYRFMIRVAHSHGPVVIRNLELNGNLGAMRIGGEWGDTGWQIPMTGIALVDNRGGEVLSDLYLHDHGQDGLLIDGPAGTMRSPLVIERVRCIRNGRQGCSIVGGSGYRFVDCEFSQTGRGPVFSAPGAGVDIEAEGGKRVERLTFERCVFDDNYGAGMVADSGPSSDVSFNACRFVGTSNWSVWPSKPKFRFQHCSFAGAVVRAFASTDPKVATQFVDCVFTDTDPATGRRVYGGDGAVPMVDLGGSYQAGLNVSFVRCKFDFRLGGKLPWTAGSIFESVLMSQASEEPAYPRGVYRGHSVIRGPAVLASTRVEGSVILNGRQVR